MINKAEERLIENWMWDNFNAINNIDGDTGYEYDYVIRDNQLFFSQDNQNWSDYPDLEVLFEENNFKLIIKNHFNCYWSHKVNSQLEYTIPRDFNNLFYIISECYKFKIKQDFPDFIIFDYQNEYDKIINTPNNYSYTPSSGIAQIWGRIYSEVNNIYTNSEIKSIPYNTPREIFNLIRNEQIGFSYFQKIDDYYQFHIFGEFNGIEYDYLMVKF